MLKTVRMVMAVLCLILLSVGYGASQLAYPHNAADYADKVDQPVVRWLALALLVISIALALVPDKEHANRQ